MEPLNQASMVVTSRSPTAPGPTAVGKTNASIEVAKRLGGEVISADSVQVFRGLDIGSDKVSGQQEVLQCHHPQRLCSVHSPE